MSAATDSPLLPVGDVPDITPEVLHRLLAVPDAPPLLLDLWAPWCQPCIAQGPALQRLVAVTAGRLRVAKLDTQKFPEVAQGLHARGIPLLVIFRDGREVARRTGQQSFEQLCAWVDEVGGNDALVDTTAPAFRAPPPLGGAFYGDDGLRRFLLERALALAADGKIENPRFPVWGGDRGSISCALVRHRDEQVFARITGLPVSFAIALHFADVATVAALNEVFAALPAGADARRVAPGLLIAWFGDTSLDWRGLLGEEADAVRRDWLHLCNEQLDGEPPLPRAWESLQARAQALVSPDPLCSVARHFGQLIARISPLPPLEGADGWGAAMLATGTYLVLSFVGHELGWTPMHYAFEGIQHSWFVAECPNPEATSRQAMDALHARFEQEHAELVAATRSGRERFFAELPQRVEPYRARLRAQLIDALRRARGG